MPKKKIIADVTDSEETVDTPETVEETSPEILPTTVEELSPLIVSLQNEINLLQVELQASRAAFVQQTDKQLSKIADLDAIMVVKQSSIDEANTLMAQIPDLQAQKSEVINAANSVVANANKQLADVVSREQAVSKREDGISEKEMANLAKEAGLISFSQTLEVRDAGITAREQAVSGLKSALGLK